MYSTPGFTPAVLVVQLVCRLTVLHVEVTFEHSSLVFSVGRRQVAGCCGPLPVHVLMTIIILLYTASVWLVGVSVVGWVD